jgi:hypothetical protein
MIAAGDVGQLLRSVFGGRASSAELDALAARADAAVATIAGQPGLHPLMAAMLTSLYGAEPVAAPAAAIDAADARHGAGDALLYEYDPAEQAHFEAECARDEAGDDDWSGA